MLGKYSEYSLLLSTSVSETFGLAVAESIAHGTPVVCTDSGGIRDFVNETNGVIIGINDAEGAVDAIELCLKKKFDYNNMRAEVLKRYGVDNYKLKQRLIVNL